MPQARDIALEQLTAAGDALPVMSTRVDAAHSLGSAPVELPPLAELPVAEAIADLVRVEGVAQLHAQADQLAAHLRQRQQELDHREAQLNARLAEFEQEVREARLWLAERNEELSRREDGVSGGPAVEGAEFSGQEPKSAAGLNAAHALVGDGRGEGLRPPAFPPTEIPPPDRKLADPPRPARPEQPQRTLLRTGDPVDDKEAVLEKLRKEISQTHREALELRLAAEEAQARLCLAVGAKAAEKALRAARDELAKSFHEEAAELTRQRQELEWLKDDLTQEHRRLQERCDELKALMSGIRS